MEPVVNWGAVNFLGGFAGCQRAMCGALSAGAVALGFVFGSNAKDPARVKEAREKSRQLAKQLFETFESRFGDTQCRQLTGCDFGIPAEREAFFSRGEHHDKCEKYVEFVIRAMLRLDDRRVDGKR